MDGDIWRDEDDGGGLPHVRSIPAAAMVGARVGMWLVLALSTPSSVGRTRYFCRCDCGAERIVARDALRGQHPSRSCRPCASKLIGLAARGRKRRVGTGQGRAATISMRRFSVREHALSLLEYPVAEHATYERPVTRGDCLAGGSNAARPCPWVSCAYHLALDVSEDSGNIKLTFPGTEVEDMQHTCSLDLAEGDGATLDEIGAAQNVSRERVRQIELQAIAHLRAERDMRRLADVEHTDSRGEIDHSDDGSGALSTADAVAGLSMLCGGGGAWGWVR